jgi:hypothetical protein
METLTVYPKNQKQLAAVEAAGSQENEGIIAKYPLLLTTTVKYQFDHPKTAIS